MKDLIIPKTSLSVQFREIGDVKFDNEPNLRAYCSQSPDQFNVQIRGTLPLYTDKNLYSRGVKPRNLIATITLSSDEILQLAELVAREKLDYDSILKEEQEQEKHDKFLVENFEENGDPKYQFD